MDMWKKYTYVCDPDSCDTLTEITSKTEPKHTLCSVCGKFFATVVSIEDAGVDNE